MAGKDLEKFIEKYPTYIEALEMLEQKAQLIAELEQELAKYKELQDRLGLKNADEFEWFVMLDLLTDNEKNMHILDLNRELAELKEKAIVPKFKIGQKIWHILCNNGTSCVVLEDVITNIKGCIYSLKKCRFCAIEEELFTTEQEAQEKLKELQND